MLGRSICTKLTKKKIVQIHDAARNQRAADGIMPDTQLGTSVSGSREMVIGSNRVECREHPHVHPVSRPPPSICSASDPRFTFLPAPVANRGVGELSVVMKC